jgi:hypothetical protein
MILTFFLPLAILRSSLKRACREATLCVHELETQTALGNELAGSGKHSKTAPG